ncbi:MAG: cysteine desulfurase family protein [Candidatus Komeilibacteria bacterium]
MSKYIYFDNAATTKVDQRVLKAMQPWFSRYYGNPASAHYLGQKASAAITNTRQKIANFLYCEPEELIFTAGATEANNLAIKGIVKYYQNLYQSKKISGKPHIITSAIEHPSVRNTFMALKKEGIDISFVQSESSGLVDVDKIIKLITENTILISLMYVNNETGVIQEVQKLGKDLLDINRQRKEVGLERIYFHSDAVQALNYLNCRPDHLKVDLLAVSGHKIYGPKGVGMLYCREQTPLIRMMDGGVQERARRAGTLNTSGIVGLGRAVELIESEQTKIIAKILALEEQWLDYLNKQSALTLNTSATRVPGLCNIRVANYLAEDLLIKLDLAGIGLSAGAACSSGAVKASPVLLAQGLNEQQALTSVRISLGKYNSSSEVKRLIKKFDILLKKNE